MKYDWDTVLKICSENSGQTLKRLKNLDWPLEELLKIAPIPVEQNPYGRAVLHRSNLGEVLLMGWRKEMFCMPHDHGDSYGFVCFLKGSFVEQSWNWFEGDLIVKTERSISAPEVITISKNSIHNMKSVDDGLSLHIYLPEINKMRVYDLSSKEILIVTDDCGAWIPTEPIHIISKRSWNKERK